MGNQTSKNPQSTHKAEKPSYWPDNDLADYIPHMAEAEVLQQEKPYAVICFKEYESDCDSDLDEERKTYICGLFSSWQDALFSLYIRQGTFRNGYVAILKNGEYVKDDNPEIKHEWHRLMQYHSLHSKLESLRYSMRERAEKQRACLGDFENTINIVSNPSAVPFGKEKLGYSKRHLHHLLNNVYAEHFDHEFAISKKINHQISRCSVLTEYEHEARHTRPIDFN